MANIVNKKTSQLLIRGFTLIELVVTMMILAIMAAVVVPRFFSSSGFEEYTYQAEVVSTLRAVQLRAMQQTDGTQCHTLKILSLGGTANKRLALMASTGSPCHASSIHDTKPNEFNPTSVDIANDHAMTFSSTFNSNEISFNSLGQPSACTGSCKITISGGEKDLEVFINSEGYIYAQ